MHLPCNACKKQPATVHLTDIAPDGEKRERHLCETCSQKEGVTPTGGSAVSLTQMLSAFIGGGKVTAQQIADLRCPQCKLTFIEFRNNGQLGCPHDYDAFEKALVPLVERAHQGASRHIGKAPHRHERPRIPENDLIRLRQELTRAVDNEKFEEAARIRDNIREIELQ
ncbi:MAG TPA: UvrB/UvrC motif-containing protein [Phycisphaerae bacterium]|nr:UvrB/UvrC motif-containing protein [Phycisphaerae bacterium]